MAIYMWRDEPLPDYLCFTANTANSTVGLGKSGNPTAVTLETSTDSNTRTTYTIGSTITLSNIGDKVYFRNKSATDTGFSLNSGAYYKFVMTGSIASSGDITYLINKNGTDTLSSDYCFYYLFKSCTQLTSAPKLPATTLTKGCYEQMFVNCTGLTTIPELPATTLVRSCYYMMFYGCSNLTTLPKLPATTLTDYCYGSMFIYCSKIKLSTTQTGEYQTAYRIPTTGTGTAGSFCLSNMFDGTGGTRYGTPTINTAYYTSNQVI